MSEPLYPLRLPGFSRSTLPDPRSFHNCVLMILEPNGTRHPWFSDGSTWFQIDAGGGSSTLAALTDIATYNLAANNTSLTTALAGKQATLIGTVTGGQNLKTVNGQTLLGTGDLTISGTAAWGAVTGGVAGLFTQTDLAKQISMLPIAMGALVIDITNSRNTKAAVALPASMTFSAAPTVAGQRFGLRITVTTAGLLTLPSFFSDLTQTGGRTTVFLPIGEWTLEFEYDGAQVVLYGEPAMVNNLAATTDPTVSSDGTQGYAAGSLWINQSATPPRIWTNLSNATGAATWMLMGYAYIPIQSISAAYTAALGDTGTCLYHPPADTTARVWTIPANASVAFPIGATLMFENDLLAGVLTIAITTDTMVLVGAAGGTGSRTLAAGGRATAVKVSATRWRISGTAELT